MSSNIQDIIARLLGQPASIFGGQAPQPQGQQWPQANDFGLSDPTVASPPQDFIASPNPSQPLPPQVRNEGFRRMITDFTYGLGSGLSAATQNPIGRGLRTEAGMGAILQQPMVLQKAKEALAAQTRDENLKKAQILAGILGQQQQGQQAAATLGAQQQNYQSEDVLRQAQIANMQADNEHAKQVDEENRAKQSQALEAQKAQEAAGVEVPGSRATVLKDGKPTESWHVRITDPETGVVRTETRYGDQAYEKPEAPRNIDPLSPEGIAASLKLKTAEAALKPSSNDLPDLKYLTDTTTNGNSYIDASKVEPKTLNELQQSSGKAGIKVVDKDTAAGLKEADTVRANQKTMMDLVESKLPKDAAGRFLKGPANSLEKLAQTDPKLASMGTFSAAAISALRAVAGAKNFRITQTELNNAIQNYVPQSSDTLDTARQKLKNLSDFLDNKEKVIFGNIPSTPAAAGTWKVIR